MFYMYYEGTFVGTVDNPSQAPEGFEVKDTMDPLSVVPTSTISFGFYSLGDSNDTDNSDSDSSTPGEPG